MVEENKILITHQLMIIALLEVDVGSDDGDCGVVMLAVLLGTVYVIFMKSF